MILQKVLKFGCHGDDGQPRNKPIRRLSMPLITRRCINTRKSLADWSLGQVKCFTKFQVGKIGNLFLSTALLLLLLLMLILMLLSLPEAEFKYCRTRNADNSPIQISIEKNIYFKYFEKKCETLRPAQHYSQCQNETQFESTLFSEIFDNCLIN